MPSCWCTFPSHSEPPPPSLHLPLHNRYSWNWLKIRAFGLTQYDAILLVDSDAIVVGSLRPLFGLPTDFAAVWDQARWMNR